RSDRDWSSDVCSSDLFIAVMLNTESEEELSARFIILAWILLGAAAGSLLASVQRHPRRALGLVPLGTSGLAIGLILAAYLAPGRSEERRVGKEWRARR